MAENIELGSAVLSVGISTEKVGRDLTKAVRTVGGNIGAIGKSSGDSFARQFNRATTGMVKSLEADQKQLAASVEAAARRVKTAREAMSAADRKLVIEETKLAEITSKAGAKQSQVLTAQDRVTKAKLAAAAASDKVAAETRKQSSAEDVLQKNLAETQAASNKTARSLRERFKGIGKGENPFRALPKQAGTSGDEAGKSFSGRMRSGIKGGIGKVGGVLATGLAGAGAVAGAGIAAAIGKGVAGASDLQQSIGAVGAVFKKDADKIYAAGETAARGLGLTKNAYNEMASTLGAGLKNQGIKDYTAQTQDLISLGADLSAQYGGSTKDAVEALGSAMRGETDPAERYGLSLNETAVQSQAVSMGLVKAQRDTDKIAAAQIKADVAQRQYNKAVKEHGKESEQAQLAQARLIGAQSTLNKLNAGSVPQLTNQQKAQARLALIQKQSADAQGAFARETDTLAHKQQVAKAQLDNLVTALGTNFLPAATKAMGIVTDTLIPAMADAGPKIQAVGSAFMDAGRWINENKGTIGAVAGIIATLLTPALVAYGVQSTIAWAKASAAAVAGAARQVASLTMTSFGWVRAGVAATASGLAQVGAWARAGAGAAANGARQAAALAIVAGGWVKTGAQAGIAAGIQVASNIRAAASFVAVRAAMLGQLAVMGAVRAATLIWTGVQWALNVALNANPIGLVVLAIAALVGGLILAYKRSATFRAVVQTAMKGVQIAIGWVVSKAKELWAYVRDNWPAIKTALVRPLTLAWSAIKTTWNWITGKFTAVKNWVTGTWSTAWAAAKYVITHPIDAAKTTIARILGKTGLQQTFSNAVSAIGRIWAGLQDKAKAPIRFVVTTVLNGGLISAFNKVAGYVGAKSIDKIKLPKGFRTGTANTGGRPGEVRGPVHGDEAVIKSPSRRRAEKAIPGGLDYLNRTGLWPTGPMGDTQGINQQAAPGPGVPVSIPGLPTDLRDLARRGPRRGDHTGYGANDKGGGGAAGTSGRGAAAVGRGMAKLGSMGWYRRCLAFVNAAWAFQIPRFRLATARQSQNAGPRTMEGRPPAGAAVYWDTGGWAGHIALANGKGQELSNDIVKAGRIDLVPDSAFRTKWGAKYMGWWHPYGAAGGAGGLGSGDVSGGGGSVFDVLGAFKSKLGGFSAALKKIGSSPFAQLAKGAALKLKDAAWDKLKKLNPISAGAEALSKVGKTLSVAKWAPMVLRALKHVGLPMSQADNWLRQIKSESGGNPNAVQGNIGDVNNRSGDLAKGLLQVIGATFAAYRDKGLPNNRFDPFANMVAAMRYAKARYGSSIEAVIGHGHGYLKGTPFVPTSGPAFLSEDGRPELVIGPQLRNLQRGSQVLNGDQTAALMGGGTGLTINGNVTTVSVEDLTREWETRMRNHMAVARF